MGNIYQFEEKGWEQTLLENFRIRWRLLFGLIALAISRHLKLWVLIAKLRRPFSKYVCKI